MRADQDIPDLVMTFRVPLGSPDAIVVHCNGARQAVILADPECPDDHVEALEMAARSLALGEAPEDHIGTPPEPLVGRIPRQLPGVQRQEFGLPLQTRCHY